MIIVGVDPGYAFMGVGVIELQPSSTRVLHHSTFATLAKDEDATRLDAIAEHLLDLLEHYEVDALGYENQAIVEAGKHRIRRQLQEAGGADADSNFSSSRVHEVAGIIRCAARCFDVPCYCLAPSSVKVAVLGKGGGRAKKGAVKARVRAIFGVERLSEHAADALAIALGTSVRHRRQLATLQAHVSLIH
jgi:crossover junction endodeoxyribonuclease RuvC